MQRRHDPTYYWATRRLPRDVRPAVHALYGFVRGADEIVDGPRRAAATRGAPRRARRVAGRARGGPGRRALAAPGRRRAGRRRPRATACRSRAAHLHALDAGRLRARSGSRRATSSTRYMEGSAGTVGRIMAPLLGAPERPDELRAPRGRLPADELHPRRREDWRLDRLYLPRTRRSRRRGRPRARARDAGLRELRRRRGRPRARPVRRPRRRRRGRAAAVRPGVRLASRGLPPRARPRRGDGYDVLGRARGCGRGSCRRGALAALRR